jgi:hypothetical protein
MEITHSARGALQARLAAILVGTALLLGILGLPSKALASNPSGYCAGQTIPATSWCWGAERGFVALEGWGANHAVCVGYWNGFIYSGTCSGGPNQKTYWAISGHGKPGIYNAGGSANLVNGVAWQ